MAPSSRTEPRPACCSIIPPDILARIAKEGDDEASKAAIDTLEASAGLRERRFFATSIVRNGFAAAALVTPPADARNVVYDAEQTQTLPGRKVRDQDDPPVADAAVNEAHDGAETTLAFYREVFDRASIDGNGMDVVSSVHFGRDIENAYWNGSQILYGDASGRYFLRGAFTRALDVIAHELSHGVIQYTAGLDYRKQSGALNESFADVFGSLVRQRSLGQAADEADWLIGPGILGPALPGEALRSMRAPGSANDFDRQPGDMSAYVDLPDDGRPENDHGGVHVNSGIPNRAFHLAAVGIGGNAWEAAGRIWYETLTGHLGMNSDFAECANATVEVAAHLFGARSREEQAVRHAWSEVGLQA